MRAVTTTGDHGQPITTTQTVQPGGGQGPTSAINPIHTQISEPAATTNSSTAQGGGSQPTSANASAPFSTKVPGPGESTTSPSGTTRSTTTTPLPKGTGTNTTPAGTTRISTTTEPGGHTVIIIGTQSVTLPTPSTSSVLTTLGQTITLLPPPPPGPSSTGPAPSDTTTTDTSATGTFTSGKVSSASPSSKGSASSNRSNNTPSFHPGETTAHSDHTSGPTHPTTPPTNPASSTETTKGPLHTFTTWPEVTLVPVTTSVERPKPTDHGIVVPCNIWFFNVSILRFERQRM